MALKARIIEVTHTLTFLDENDVEQAIDLSLQGQLMVRAEYFDDANPDVILHMQSFQVSARESEAQIAERVIAEAVKIRDARVRTAQLAAHVGVTLDIPAQ